MMRSYWIVLWKFWFPSLDTRENRRHYAKLFMTHFHIQMNKLVSHMFMISYVQKWKIFQFYISMISSCVKGLIRTLREGITKSCIQFTAFLWTQYLTSSSEIRDEKKKEKLIERQKKLKRWWLWMIEKILSRWIDLLYVLIYFIFIFNLVLLSCYLF